MRRCYLALHHILKELSSKRLQSDQRAFEGIASELLEPLWLQWMNETRAMLIGLPVVLQVPAIHESEGTGSVITQPSIIKASTTELDHTNNDAVHSSAELAHQDSMLVEKWLLQLKCLRRLLLFGFPSDAKSMDVHGAVQQIVPQMVHVVQSLYGLLARPKISLSNTASSNLARDLTTTTAAAAAATPLVMSPKVVQLLAMIERGMVKLAKTLREIQEVHPWSVLHSSTALASLLEFACQFVMSTSGADRRSTRNGTAVPYPLFLTQSNKVIMEQLQCQCLLLLAAVVRCPSYKGSQASLSIVAGRAREQTNKLKELSSQAMPALKDFWSQKHHDLVSTLILQYFPLTDKELSFWEESPEEFFHEMDSCFREDTVKGCAEQLYLALLEQDRRTLAPLVLHLLHRPPDSHTTENAHIHSHAVPAVLRTREGIYHAVYVGSYELFDAVDLSSWLSSSLLHELSTTSATEKPLRRAAMRVVSAWVSKLKKEEKPPIYRALIDALSISNAGDDPVIYLSSIAALNNMIEDWEFDEEQFLPYVPAAFQSLTVILQRSAEYQTQLEAFRLVGAVINRLGPSVAPFVPGLLTLLPMVWQEGEGQSLLRIQIMVALQRLIHAMGVDSPMCYPVLFPVLQVATDPNQPDELNLLEDALLLWLVTLRHATRLDDHGGLLAPLPHLLAAMEGSTEHVSVGTRLMTSCLLLAGGREIGDVLNSTVIAARAPDDVLSGLSPLSPTNNVTLVQGMNRVLTKYIGNIKERGMLYVVPVLDIAMQVYPPHEGGFRVFESALHALFLDVLGGKESGMVVAASLGLFSRVILSSPAVFLQLVQTVSVELISVQHMPQKSEKMDAVLQNIAGNKQLHAIVDPAHKLLLAYLDVWLEKFDSIGHTAARKLNALALCVLLTIPVPFLQKYFHDIVVHVSAVWFEIEGPDIDPGSVYGLEFLMGGVGPRDDDIPVSVNLDDAESEAERRKMYYERSAVKTMKLGVFFKQQCEAAVGVHGVDAINAAVNALDPALREQFNMMLQTSSG